jgi:hypothetical protein
MIKKMFWGEAKIKIAILWPATIWFWLEYFGTNKITMIVAMAI